MGGAAGLGCGAALAPPMLPTAAALGRFRVHVARIGRERIACERRGGAQARVGLGAGAALRRVRGRGGGLGFGRGAESGNPGRWLSARPHPPTPRDPKPFSLPLSLVGLHLRIVPPGEHDAVLHDERASEARLLTSHILSAVLFASGYVASYFFDGVVTVLSGAAGAGVAGGGWRGGWPGSLTRLPFPLRPRASHRAGLAVDGGHAGALHLGVETETHSEVVTLRGVGTL